MIRQLLQSWLGTCDDYVENLAGIIDDLQGELSDLLDENIRLVGKVAELAGECQSLRQIIEDKDADLASFMDERFKL